MQIGSLGHMSYYFVRAVRKLDGYCDSTAWVMSSQRKSGSYYQPEVGDDCVHCIGSFRGTFYKYRRGRVAAVSAALCLVAIGIDRNI